MNRSRSSRDDNGFLETFLDVIQVREPPSSVHCERCGLQTLGARSIELGALVDGRYRLDKHLGNGASGQVFEGCDVHLGRSIALKLMHETTGPCVDFEWEARALASVRHHNIPILHTFGMHGDTPFFVMELVEGATLSDVQDDHAHHGAHLPVFRAVSIIHQLALALAAAHARGIVHRDVKPNNVIIEADTGRPVLVDFGIAVRLHEDVTRGVSGTPAYIAPEVLRGERATHASDLYSLGCLAYEVLCGRLPFTDTNIDDQLDAHLHRRPPALSAVRPELAPFDDVIMRALSKSPTDRQPTCTAFAAELERVEPEAEEIHDSEISLLLQLERGTTRVLIVDDDPVFARLAKRAASVAFADTELEISRAKTGEAAVRNMQRTLPQLLILDYRLPGMDGAEVLSRIRVLPGGERVSVLVVSGGVGESERWRFSSLGVRDFLEKPVDFGRLVETIVRQGRTRGWLALQ